MRDNTFSKKVFIKTVSDNLKNKYRKTIDDATQQELYQAVSEAVKDVIMDEWIATQRVMDKDVTMRQMQRLFTICPWSF